jgi:23S rRNA pseudouridine2605 synthase
LANAGLGSRRQIERWITAGRVVVDGQPAQIGQPLVGHEKVFFDGRPIKLAKAPDPSNHTTIAYYKPAGELTAQRDPEGRKTVFDSLPRPPQGRWVSVGRLDLSTSGLLLLTTDGELAHRLMHPSYEISREYAVRLLGTLSDEQLLQLSEGITLDDGPAKFEKITFSGGEGQNVWYHVSLKEGRNREIRRIFEALGITVSRLIRIRYGPIDLGKLKRGISRKLGSGELLALYRAVKLQAPKR